MNQIPAKVFAIAGLEAGFFIGMGIIFFHTVRVMYTATKREAWKGFRSL